MSPGENHSMANLHSQATAPMRDWEWSPAEKVTARRAFDLAPDKLEAIHSMAHS